MKKNNLFSLVLSIALIWSLGINAAAGTPPPEEEGAFSDLGRTAGELWQGAKSGLASWWYGTPTPSPAPETPAPSTAEQPTEANPHLAEPEKPSKTVEPPTEEQLKPVTLPEVPPAPQPAQPPKINPEKLPPSIREMPNVIPEAQGVITSEKEAVALAPTLIPQQYITAPKPSLSEGILGGTASLTKEDAQEVAKLTARAYLKVYPAASKSGLQDAIKYATVVYYNHPAEKIDDAYIEAVAKKNKITFQQAKDLSQELFQAEKTANLQNAAQAGVIEAVARKQGVEEFDLSDITNGVMDMWSPSNPIYPSTRINKFDEILSSALKERDPEDAKSITSTLNEAFGKMQPGQPKSPGAPSVNPPAKLTTPITLPKSAPQELPKQAAAAQTGIAESEPSAPSLPQLPPPQPVEQRVLPPKPSPVAQPVAPGETIPQLPSGLSAKPTPVSNPVLPPKPSTEPPIPTLSSELPPPQPVRPQALPPKPVSAEAEEPGITVLSDEDVIALAKQAAINTAKESALKVSQKEAETVAERVAKAYKQVVPMARADLNTSDIQKATQYAVQAYSKRPETPDKASFEAFARTRNVPEDQLASSYQALVQANEVNNLDNAAQAGVIELLAGRYGATDTQVNAITEGLMQGLGIPKGPQAAEIRAARFNDIIQSQITDNTMAANNLTKAFGKMQAQRSVAVELPKSVSAQPVGKVPIAETTAPKGTLSKVASLLGPEAPAATTPADITTAAQQGAEYALKVPEYVASRLPASTLKDLADVSKLVSNQIVPDVMRALQKEGITMSSVVATNLGDAIGSAIQEAQQVDTMRAPLNPEGIAKNVLEKLKASDVPGLKTEQAQDIIKNSVKNGMTLFGLTDTPTWQPNIAGKLEETATGVGQALEDAIKQGKPVDQAMQDVAQALAGDADVGQAVATNKISSDLLMKTLRSSAQAMGQTEDEAVLTAQNYYKSLGIQRPIQPAAQEAEFYKAVRIQKPAPGAEWYKSVGIKKPKTTQPQGAPKVTESTPSSEYNPKAISDALAKFGATPDQEAAAKNVAKFVVDNGGNSNQATRTAIVFVQNLNKGQAADEAFTNAVTVIRPDLVSQSGVVKVFLETGATDVQQAATENVIQLLREAGMTNETSILDTTESFIKSLQAAQAVEPGPLSAETIARALVDAQIAPKTLASAPKSLAKLGVTLADIDKAKAAGPATLPPAPKPVTVPTAPMGITEQKIAEDIANALQKIEATNDQRVAAQKVAQVALNAGKNPQEATGIAKAFIQSLKNGQTTANALVDAVPSDIVDKAMRTRAFADLGVDQNAIDAARAAPKVAEAPSEIASMAQAKGYIVGGEDIETIIGRMKNIQPNGQMGARPAAVSDEVSTNAEGAARRVIMNSLDYDKFPSNITEAIARTTYARVLAGQPVAESIKSASDLGSKLQVQLAQESGIPKKLSELTDVQLRTLPPDAQTTLKEMEKQTPVAESIVEPKPVAQPEPVRPAPAGPKVEPQPVAQPEPVQPAKVIEDPLLKITDPKDVVPQLTDFLGKAQGSDTAKTLAEDMAEQVLSTRAQFLTSGIQSPLAAQLAGQAGKFAAVAEDALGLPVDPAAAEEAIRQATYTYIAGIQDAFTQLSDGQLGLDAGKMNTVLDQAGRTLMRNSALASKEDPGMALKAAMSVINKGGTMNAARNTVTVARGAVRAGATADEALMVADRFASFPPRTSLPSIVTPITELFEDAKRGADIAEGVKAYLIATIKISRLAGTSAEILRVLDFVPPADAEKAAQALIEALPSIKEIDVTSDQTAVIINRLAKAFADGQVTSADQMIALGTAMAKAFNSGAPISEVEGAAKDVLKKLAPEPAPTEAAKPTAVQKPAPAPTEVTQPKPTTEVPQPTEKIVTTEVTNPGGTTPVPEAAKPTAPEVLKPAPAPPMEEIPLPETSAIKPPAPISTTLSRYKPIQTGLKMGKQIPSKTGQVSPETQVGKVTKAPQSTPPPLPPEEEVPLQSAAPKPVVAPEVGVPAAAPAAGVEEVGAALEVKGESGDYIPGAAAIGEIAEGGEEVAAGESTGVRIAARIATWSVDALSAEAVSGAIEFVIVQGIFTAATEAITRFITYLIEQPGMVDQTLYEATCKMTFEGHVGSSCDDAHFTFYPYPRKDLANQPNWAQVGGSRGSACIVSRYYADVYVPTSGSLSIIKGSQAGGPGEKKTYSFAIASPKAAGEQLSLEWHREK